MARDSDFRTNENRKKLKLRSIRGMQIFKTIYNFSSIRYKKSGWVTPNIG